MFDIKAALRNNVISITAALAGGLYAAFQISPAWALIAIPTFVFVFGMERLYAALPTKLKPFAGLISLVAFFIVMLLLINFIAALWKSPTVQQAITQQATTLTQPVRGSINMPLPVPAEGIQADPETANRIYGLFLAELNKRNSATEGFDQVTWMQAMTECLGSDNQQGTLTPQEMEKIAGCADQRMKERLQKAP